MNSTTVAVKMILWAFVTAALRTSDPSMVLDELDSTKVDLTQADQHVIDMLWDALESIRVDYISNDTLVEKLDVIINWCKANSVHGQQSVIE